MQVNEREVKVRGIIVSTIYSPSNLLYTQRSKTNEQKD